MRKLSVLFITMTIPFAGRADLADKGDMALRDIERSMTVMEAAWKTSIKGHSRNLYMVDSYDTATGALGGTSDVWPYTAAIEAHCSILEALEAAKESVAELYEEKSALYLNRLEQLIDNLEYYRGTLTLHSYANTAEWQPYAVPRSRTKGGADVSGILNVYDDQMWLARELIRAYRLTDNSDYLQTATRLIDYCLDGWDCWRDADGNEYGGITWGPGYNSKHACSNAPIIQPLTWLYDIYKDSDETVTYNYRDRENKVVSEERNRAEHYLDFARKVYDWQKRNLLHSSGVYWDMMGADNTIKTAGGYRQHVDCGGATGSLISYNTGTMIAGAAELYRISGEPALREELSATSKASLNQFAKYVRKHNTYDFTTDQTAGQGFNTWFNDVLMRGLIDAEPYSENSSATNAINAFQNNLDYAFDNHLRDGLLPIHLLDGWGSETQTKGFHQFAFASQYAMLATRLLKDITDPDGVEQLEAASSDVNETVYSITGIKLGKMNEVGDLPKGLYIVGSKKMRLGK